jgi:hypothetical protein
VSREAWLWAWRLLPDLPVEQGKVLLYIAREADLTGVCLTRHETIAEENDLTVEQVKRCLDDLARTSRLTVEPLRSKGRRGVLWIELLREASQ